jgi:hypothetical protein
MCYQRNLIRAIRRDCIAQSVIALMEMRGVFEYLEAVMLSPVRFGQLRTDLRNTSNFAEFDTLPTRFVLTGAAFRDWPKLGVWLYRTNLGN